MNNLTTFTSFEQRERKLLRALVRPHAGQNNRTLTQAAFMYTCNSSCPGLIVLIKFQGYVNGKLDNANVT